MEKNLNIKPNQNLIGLIVGLSSVGLAEYFQLIWLFFFGFLTVIIFFISVSITLIAYTKNYYKNKEL